MRTETRREEYDRCRARAEALRKEGSVFEAEAYELQAFATKKNAETWGWDVGSGGDQDDARKG